MAVVTFHAKATLDGRDYVPGQTVEIADHWVHPLLVQRVITCPTEYQRWRMGYGAPTIPVTSRDPQPGG